MHLNQMFDFQANSKDKPIIIMHHNTPDTSNSLAQDLSTDILINNSNNSAFNTEICHSNNTSTGKILIINSIVGS